MTRDEVIKLAQECGAGFPNDLYGRTDYIVMAEYELQRFANLVAAHEREACAKLCYYHAQQGFNSSAYNAAMELRDAIRARGQE